MKLTEIILQDLDQVRAYTLDLLAHVDEGDWFRQPQAGLNHIAWQVGHLAIVEYSLCLKRIWGRRDSDDSVVPVDEYLQLFGKGSQPSADSAAYPNPSEIRGFLNAVHARVLAETATLEDSQLEESCGPAHPMFSTKGGALRFCPKHEMLHAGQIALLRRMFGGEILR